MFLELPTKRSLPTRTRCDSSPWSEADIESEPNPVDIM